MEDPQGEPTHEDSIASLLNEIRTANPMHGDRRPSHANNRATANHAKRYNDEVCRCGERKFPDAPRCPTCAHEAGLIDQATKQKLLDALTVARKAPEPSYGSTICNCGRRKIRTTSQCKPCAIERGALEAKVEPSEEPCPRCGDGKKPAFSYCTGCAIAEGYITEEGQIHQDCPIDDCHCGGTKYAAYSQCSKCSRGITGFRHQDWTTGPNPVPIFSPLPPENRRVAPSKPHAAGSRATPASSNPATPSNATLPCWRCERPTEASKRFCIDCLKEMGAPPEAFNGEFNDRSRHEQRPPHMQGRG